MRIDSSGLETLVGLGVVGQQRHLLAGHHVEDGLEIGTSGASSPPDSRVR